MIYKVVNNSGKYFILLCHDIDKRNILQNRGEWECMCGESIM